MTLYNLIRAYTATVGTGSMAMGAAVSGYLDFTSIPTGTIVSYGIIEGANSEVGRGTWTSATGTLSRDTVFSSTNSGDKVTLGGSAEVFVTNLAEDHRGWDDIQPYYITGQGPSVAGTAQYGTTGFFWYKFTNSAAKDEELQYSFQIPHRCATGASIYPHLHVVPSANGTAGNQDVKMSISYQWVNTGDAFSTTTLTTPTASKFTVAADGANKHTLWAFDAIVGTGKTLSSDLSVIVKRLSKTDAEDNYTGDVWFRYIDLHVQIDSLGSYLETTK